MKIEILTLCHCYQRRLCWNLSSIADQDLPEDMEIVPAVCALSNNGDPTTEEVIRYFKRRRSLRVKFLEYQDQERFALRGYTRNDQLKLIDPDTDYVLFSDCDMVYSKGFFRELKAKLEPYKGQKAFYTVGRKSQRNVVAVNNMINALAYPRFVCGYEYIINFSDRRMANVGAGYFQMMQPQFMERFVAEGRNHDWHMFNKGLNPISDVQFRKGMEKSGVEIVRFRTSAKQYHLNHNRDPEAAGHIEEQR